MVYERARDRAARATQLEDAGPGKPRFGRAVEAGVLARGSPPRSRTALGPLGTRAAGRARPATEHRPTQRAGPKLAEAEAQLEATITALPHPRPDPPTSGRRPVAAIAGDAHRHLPFAGLPPGAEQPSPDPGALNREAEVVLIFGADSRRKELQAPQRRQRPANAQREHDVSLLLVQARPGQVEGAPGVVAVVAGRRGRTRYQLDDQGEHDHARDGRRDRRADPPQKAATRAHWATSPRLGTPARASPRPAVG